MKRVLAIYGKGEGPTVALPPGPAVLEVRGIKKHPLELYSGDEVHVFERDGEYPFQNAGDFRVVSAEHVHCIARTE